MKNVSRYKVEKSVLIPLIILAIISITTIFSAQSLLDSSHGSLFIKQGLWFFVGFVLAYLIMYIGNDFLYKNVYILYWIGVIALIGLLLFADPINNSKCWFSIPGIGTIQPSEFMKIILILTLARTINDFNDEHDNPTIEEEFKFLLKILLIVGIPSILTFLQPDTGVVLIYLLITLCMLFVSGIRYRWFIFAFGFLFILIGAVVGTYFLSQDLFIKIFGIDFFYRIDRILDWQSGSGMQLENALMAIGSGGLFGKGFNNTPVYFPEPHTDFIFAVFASNYGLIGSILLVALLVFLDVKIINLGVKSVNNINKYAIAGVVGMLLYQQIQNIGMTIGLLPITGITLPFISYGGSSLLSYMIMAGIVFSVSNENLRYTN
ncbi:MAG: FtsW/RodA/SpoVE family cell cycle protein [Bacilli bacterium]|nr:FtsW/RodA/SpoVE family cell cycle protein [Bacilli bacterium]